MKSWVAIPLIALALVGCTQIQTPPPPPSNLKSTTTSWKIAQDGVTTFQFYKNGEPIFAAPAAITSFTDLNLPPGVQVCYYVVPVSNELQGPPSNIECRTP